jgi:gamma-glutamyltranspeptidase/glutathione hydrolase
LEEAFERGGVVAAGDPQTARAGARVLRAGGNAIDAVVGAGFAACVCEAPLISPAGAGLLLHGGPGRGFEVLDFFARVPGLGGRPEALDFFAVEVDFGGVTQTFHVGRAAAAVPGLLRGLLAAHRTHGRLPLADVVAPARALASGYVVSTAIVGVMRLLEPIYALDPALRTLACNRDGARAEGGDRLANGGLGHLFESLARDARATVRAVEADVITAVGCARQGLLSTEDLAAYAPRRRAPIAVPFGDGTVIAPGAPSAGGGLVALGLRLAERSGLVAREVGDHWDHLARVVGAVSSARAAGYDRRYAEPAFMDAFLTDAAVDAVWRDHEAIVLERIAGRRPAERGLGSTTHISVIDGSGGVASMTASNGEGCGRVLEAWGVHVNNFLGEEDINPQGFHADPAGAPMMTMMAPTVFVKDGAPVLALGSGGSNRLRSAVLQGLLNHLAFGDTLEAAVTRDRLHVEGDQLWFEAVQMAPEAARALERAWPAAERFDRRSMFFGGVHVAARRDGSYLGAGDPRRDGAVCRADEV